MKTDTLFYKIFQTFPQLVFQLLDRDVVPGYAFTSVEVKEKGFRFDGIFAPPPASSEPIYFIEVQFQFNPDFYWQFLSEIFLYLNQQKPQQNWQAAAIFPSARQDVKELASIHQELINSGRVVRIYLDEITDRVSPELGMIKLITCREDEAVAVVKEIRSSTTDEDIIRFIGDILFYKFPKLSRREIEIMFALEDLRQTKVFQEAKDEGI
ncbi:MAG: Rpn family recombination-promoting nuclease/putative transposase, partial [Cyanobacteria bacterium KgW148]|nr:Rpn family recombination-promoting nuclease/putative transposase [Cyanobacteria bacterium KgW148]